jgi:hypothetical protein
MLELVPENQNHLYVFGVKIAERMMIVILPLVFYVTRDWFYIIALYFILSSLFTIFIFFIPESPKFCYAHNQFDK